MEHLFESIETLRSLNPESHLSQFLQYNVRPDQRPFQTPRPITILPSLLTRNSHGSSLVSLGETRALSTISLQIGRPSPSHPRRGELMTSLHTSPLCHSCFDTYGKVSQQQQKQGAIRDVKAVEGFVRRMMIHAGVLDLEDLCIDEGRSAWRVHVSIVILNHDGNIEDVAIVGAVAALMDLKLPETVMVGDKVKVVEREEEREGREVVSKSRRRVEVRCIPVPLSVGLFGDKLLVDPTWEEEEVLDGVFNIVMNENEGLIGMNKVGGASLSIDDMKACMVLARRRVKELVPVMRSLSSGDAVK